MMFDAYIFDLDGTILDTLPDLVRLTNMVLEERGCQTRSRDEILSYVGDGGRMLLKRAMPSGTPDLEIDAAFERWRALYPEYGHAMTAPYEGVPDTLRELKERGARLGVLSNKFDEAVRQVVSEHFPGVFDLARGECEEIPRKPDPAGLKFMMERLGVSPACVAFVGDSPSDLLVARRAGVYGVAVSWGYQSVESLISQKPDALIDEPARLLSL